MDNQQETRDEKPLTFADLGITAAPKLEEGALGKVHTKWRCYVEQYNCY